MLAAKRAYYRLALRGSQVTDSFVEMQGVLGQRCSWEGTFIKQRRYIKDFNSDSWRHPSNFSS